jgi:hypothetical protein
VRSEALPERNRAEVAAGGMILGHDAHGSGRVDGRVAFLGPSRFLRSAVE